MVEPTQQIVEGITNTVKNAGSGGVGKMLMAPINVVSGLGKGVFNSLTNISGMLMSSGILFGLMKFAPDVVKWLPLKIKGEKLGDILAEDIEKGGTGAMLKNSLIGGAVVNAAIGGAGGMVGEVMGTTEGQESSTMSKVMGFAGGALAIAGVAAVTMGAVHRNGIGYAGEADGSTPKTPAAVPNNAANTDVKQK